MQELYENGYISTYKSNRSAMGRKAVSQICVCNALFRKRLDKNMRNKGFGLWRPVKNDSDLGSAQHLN